MEICINLPPPTSALKNVLGAGKCLLCITVVICVGAFVSFSCLLNTKVRVQVERGWNPSALGRGKLHRSV